MVEVEVPLTMILASCHVLGTNLLCSPIVSSIKKNDKPVGVEADFDDD